MFGRRFYGGRFYGPKYWGDGGLLPPPEPPPPDVAIPKPAGAAIRPHLRPRESQEVVHASITISGGGSILVIGRKTVEYPPDDEILAFLGMV